MTIQFNCPNCGELIAFADKHCGKRAHCTTCEKRFIVPSRSNETPEKIKPPKEMREPLAGFYRAVFIDSRNLFTTAENVTGLGFIVGAVCLKFFTARMNYTMIVPGRSLTFEFPLPFGRLVNLATWGFLFWYYMEVIYSTAFEQEELPEVNVGGGTGLFMRIVKSIYTFFIVLLVVEPPYIVVAVILSKTQTESPVPPQLERTDANREG